MHTSHAGHAFTVSALIALSACTGPGQRDQAPATQGPPLVAVTAAEVDAAQQGWCDGLLKISRIYAEGGDYRAAAEQMLTDDYDYDEGRVFFKPTLSSGPQTFRNTKAGALSYFVAGDSAYPDDKGFALKPWVKCTYENSGDPQIYGDIGITMGNVYFTAKDGSQVTVDKTFVFRKGKDGRLRLVVHKSSFPYNPKG